MAKEDQNQNLTPTPPLGCPIYFALDPRQGEWIPGWVVGIEDVGRIAVSCIRPNGSTFFRRGVMHNSHPDMRVGGPQSKNGAWKLQEWMQAPRGLYDLAKEREERRARAKEEAEKVQAAIARQEANMRKLAQEQEPQGV